MAAYTQHEMIVNQDNYSDCGKGQMPTVGGWNKFTEIKANADNKTNWGKGSVYRFLIESLISFVYLYFTTLRTTPSA